MKTVLADRSTAMLSRPISHAWRLPLPAPPHLQTRKIAPKAILSTVSVVAMRRTSALCFEVHNRSSRALVWVSRNLPHQSVTSSRAFDPLLMP